ncbi:MAG: glycine oxidase ThiO [Planctomycetaceae bacterium]
MARSQPDILIIGGGVIGLTIAFELAEHGLKVTVADRQAVGQEASWAGAGMLPPGCVPDSENPEARLRSLSHGLWPALSAHLQELTGYDNGYRVSGSLLFTSGPNESREVAGQWSADGARAEVIGPQRLKSVWPELSHQLSSAVWLPEQAQVRNPWHLRALRAACEKLNVELLEHVSVVIPEQRGERIESVLLGTERCCPEQVCITAGAWTAGILPQPAVSLPVRPVRGQMVQLRTSQPLFSCMLEVGRRYLVPRTDGFVLAGSTEEQVGFEKGNTAEGVAELIEFACGLVPKLRDQEFVRCWSGLRPGSADDLPLLGNVPGYENVFVAAGHFRSGLQMSPGTARILSALLRQEAPPISLAGLDAGRFIR